MLPSSPNMFIRMPAHQRGSMVKCRIGSPVPSLLRLCASFCTFIETPMMTLDTTLIATPTQTVFDPPPPSLTSRPWVSSRLVLHATSVAPESVSKRSSILLVHGPKRGPMRIRMFGMGGYKTRTCAGLWRSRTRAGTDARALISLLSL